MSRRNIATPDAALFKAWAKLSSDRSAIMKSPESRSSAAVRPLRCKSANKYGATDAISKARLLSELSSR